MMMRFLCILIVLLGAANSSSTSAFVLPPTIVKQELERQGQTALFLSSPNYKHVMTSAALFVSLWVIPFDASIAAPQAQTQSLSSSATILANPDVIVKPFGGGIGGFGISPFGVGPLEASSTPKVKSMEETGKPSLSEGVAKERQPAETFNVEKEKETRTSKYD